MRGPQEPPVDVVIDGAFRMHAVGPPLDRWVAGIWAVSGAVPVAAETVLPNGVVELIFNLGPPHRVVRDDGQHWYREAWLAGTQQGPLTIASQGSTDLVGVRFRPGGAAAVFGLPLAAVTDDVVELADLDPADRAIGSLRDRLAAVDIDTRVAIIAEALARRARQVARAPDPRVAVAVARLPTATSLRELAATLGITHKHLISRFHDDVGVTPSRLRRILRFDGVVRQLERTGPADWAALAADHGFSDQPHLVREFRALAGVTPTQFLATRLAGQSHLDASDAVAPDPVAPHGPR